MKKPQFVLLEGRESDEHSYGNLLVSLHRLSVSARVQNIAHKLGYQVKNTAKELDNTHYIGNINHQQANTLVPALKGRVLDIFQSVDLLDDLQNKKTLYDENGKPLPRQVRDALYDEIVGKRDPWRSEWLADRFAEIDRIMYRTTEYRLENGVLVPKSFERITQGQIKRIESRYKEHVSDFYPPSDGSVARFYADSGRAVIGCDWYTDDAYTSLGVRFVREKN